MSRVDSVRLAVEKARTDRCAAPSLASDAFFPFADGPELAIEARRRPPSSSRAARCATTRSIAAADAAGIAMVFTGRRHFRH